MAYRRRQGISRGSTFKEEINQHPMPSSDSDENATNDQYSHPRPHASYSSSSSLAAQAIIASAARRDPSLSSTFALEHQRSKSFDAYGDGIGNSKSGFWGVLAQKAKEILEEDDSYSQRHVRSHSFNTFTPHALAQEGRTIMESNSAELRSQIKLKGSFPKDSNQALGMWNPWQQLGQTTNPQTIHETQLKASRDVAMATAAKAKVLLCELKNVKADLAFFKARCDQLEEENKLLRDRESCEKGQYRADDDLIRLQLETLLEEKARLAKENEIYSRENRFLREIVEYHQLTMQDVVYIDEGMEEVYPMDTTSMVLPMSPRSTLSDQAVQTKAMFPMPKEQEDKNTSKEETSPSISVSEDEHRK